MSGHRSSGGINKACSGLEVLTMVCWAGSFTHQLYCLANATSNSWADVLASQVETEQFYKMDDFYTDAQYGDEWGDYSRAVCCWVEVKKVGQGKTQGTRQLAHFTTYPLALSRLLHVAVAVFALLSFRCVVGAGPVSPAPEGPPFC